MKDNNLRKTFFPEQATRTNPEAFEPVRVNLNEGVRDIVKGLFQKAGNAIRKAMRGELQLIQVQPDWADGQTIPLPAPKEAQDWDKYQKEDYAKFFGEWLDNAREKSGERAAEQAMVMLIKEFKRGEALEDAVKGPEEFLQKNLRKKQQEALLRDLAKQRSKLVEAVERQAARSKGQPRRKLNEATRREINKAVRRLDSLYSETQHPDVAVLASSVRNQNWLVAYAHLEALPANIYEEVDAGDKSFILRAAEDELLRSVMRVKQNSTSLLVPLENLAKRGLVEIVDSYDSPGGQREWSFKITDKGVQETGGPRAQRESSSLRGAFWS